MAKAILIIDMPANCKECVLYQSTGHFDEDAMWGDGMVYECPFGCSHFGCYLKRPDDCPLQPLPDNLKINKE